MTNETAAKIINLLESHKRGDDLCRAYAAFKHYTAEKMNMKYGESDSTPNQIIAGYEAIDRDIDRLVSSFKELFESTNND